MIKKETEYEKQLKRVTIARLNASKKRALIREERIVRYEKGRKKDLDDALKIFQYDESYNS